AAYYAMIEHVDNELGRIVDVLDESGQLDNTIILFHSDHGELLGDHGLIFKGSRFFEGAVHVPLIFACPQRFQTELHSDALVELVDLAPTLLDAAGVERYEGMQGRSLWPLLTGESPADTHRDDVYCEYYNAMPTHKDPAAHATMVRTRTHKLVAMHGTEPGELYDLVADPGETRNLWDDLSQVGVKADLLARLCDRMAWTVDPLPGRRANF
ncbi:MAG: sulfatase/phosphatase domain-containing protein, partial [Candidatus Poribacteria bacterium]